MTRTCRALGCGAETTSRFSVYCANHKARLRRHGDVAQKGVTKTDLKPYARIVRARIVKNAESPAWDHLDSRWNAVADHARAVLVRSQQGQAGFRQERIAALQVIQLADTVAPREIVETALAMFVMQELEARRFRSDGAFRTQLVRRIRGLLGGNARNSGDDTSGRTKRTYSELPPRAAAVMGQWLAEAFGGAGLRLARLEMEERNREQGERQELHQALSELL